MWQPASRVSCHRQPIDLTSLIFFRTCPTCGSGGANWAMRRVLLEMPNLSRPGNVSTHSIHPIKPESTKSHTGRVFSVGNIVLRVDDPTKCLDGKRYLHIENLVFCHLVSLRQAIIGFVIWQHQPVSVRCPTAEWYGFD